MAEPLKSFFSPALVRRLAGDVARVHPGFAKQAFTRRATRGLEGLELLDRGRHICRALAEHLPAGYPEAISILLCSLGPEHETDEVTGAGMAPFYYLPHVIFVAERGLDDFDLSMRAQYELTKRFSAELSIRAYLERHPELTMAVLHEWTADGNAHVRRLTSEGTRLRLPWARRVHWLEEHPERVLDLLEALKDDPSTYVRRSVANNLNDLGKVRPELLIRTCETWLRDASEERRALVEHALRSAVKRAEPQVLRLLGFGDAAAVALERVTIEPKRVAIGGRVAIGFSLRSSSSGTQDVLVDLVVHFVKANGRASAKVFKLGRVSLGPKGRADFRKTVSLAVHTTRKPNPGKHLVEAQVNGRTRPVGSFEVV
ncbi:MAG: DNA alkylation repair protein [Thermoanaerobaculia bacterium]